jgi:hypothetical protein
VCAWTIPEERPRASPERIRAFVEKYGSAELRHAAELIPIMMRDDPDESRIAVYELSLDPGLRRAYRIRAEHLASSPPSPTHPACLAADMQALVRRFAQVKDQQLRLWNTQLPSGIIYMVFELVDDEAIAGCVKSADQRVVHANP